MARCADGFASGGDPVAVAQEAVAHALKGLFGRAPDLAVVYVAGADPEGTERALLAVAAALPTATVIGSGVDGLVVEERPLGGGPAVSVWAACLPQGRVRSFHLEVMRTEHSLAVVGMPPRRADDAAVVLLADPWSFPAEGFVDSSTTALDELPIVGGLVGAHGSRDARMLVDGRVVDRGAVGVVLGGDVAVRTAVAHASRPVGPPMTVTASEGEAVLALAGRPAMDRIDAVLSDLSGQDQALASCGLLVGTVFDEYADDHGIGDFAVQAVLGAEDDTRAVILAEHVPVGTTVRLHVVDPLAARSDLDAAIAGAALDDEIEGALLFSGVPLGGAIGDPAGDAQALRRGTAARGVAGMLTVGGIGPVVGSNRLLGFASAILVVGQSTPDRVLTA